MTNVANSDLLAGYLTENEQAALLKKTVRTLRGWRKRREGPPWTKNGKQFLYNIEWTREWLAANRQDPVRPHRRRQHTDNQVTPA
jgi:hypothetical protein